MKYIIKGILTIIIATSALQLLNYLSVTAYGESETLKQTITGDKSPRTSLDKALISQKITEPVSLVTPTPEPPTPTPEPKIVVKFADVNAQVYTTDQIKRRICEVFGSQCRNALVIAQHESNFNPKAISYTNDYGVMQVNCDWHKDNVGGDCTRLFDVETNLRVAKQIYDASGWKAWSTAKFL